MLAPDRRMRAHSDSDLKENTYYKKELCKVYWAAPMSTLRRKVESNLNNNHLGKDTKHFQKLLSSNGTVQTPAITSSFSLFFAQHLQTHNHTLNNSSSNTFL